MTLSPGSRLQPQRFIKSVDAISPLSGNRVWKRAMRSSFLVKLEGQFTQTVQPFLETYCIRI